MFALGLDRTDGGGPDIETLDELLREFLQGSRARSDVLGLGDGDVEGVDISALEGDLAFTDGAGVRIGGDLQDNVGAGVQAFLALKEKVTSVPSESRLTELFAAVMSGISTP